MTPKFLSVDRVLELHAQQLARFGGGDGLRDRGLLESAVAQAAATIGGQFLHEDLLAMAGAYLFHIVSNHPFVDGNKRTGLLAAVVFLDLNGVTIEDTGGELYALTLAVASGQAGKTEMTARLRALASSDGGSL